MKIRKIEVLNMDTDEKEPAQQLVCDCGSEHFIVYSLGDDHTHLQCTQCDTPHCSKNPGVVTRDIPIQIKEESEGFNE